MTTEPSARERVREALDLIRSAHDRCNIITNDRRRIGPIATQAQTAGHALAKAELILRALTASTPSTSAVEAATVERCAKVAEALGPMSDWAEKREELYGWTGSAWLAGEPGAEQPEGLYAFLCSLIGYLMAGEDAVRALTPDHIADAGEGGWIVGNGAATQWRRWGAFGSEWTPDRDKATRYHQREDAEAVHAGDEDAWRVERYAAPAQQPRQSGEGDA